jgi:hypothetical protein
MAALYLCQHKLPCDPTVDQLPQSPVLHVGFTGKDEVRGFGGYLILEINPFVRSLGHLRTSITTVQAKMPMTVMKNL